jgi:hypothetical protein
VNLLAAKRNTHACVHRRLAPKRGVSENRYSGAYSIPRVIPTAQPLRRQAHRRSPDVAMHIPAMSKNFGLPTAMSRREPSIGQQDHRCATTRSAAVAAVQRLVIPEASPTPAFGRITGFDVFLERHDRNPALHRDRPHSGGAGSRSPKTALPEQRAHHGGNPRKADDRKHQFGYSSSVASRTHYPPRHPGGRLDVSKMFPRWHSARRLFVKMMSIVRKDRLTETAMDAVRRKLH